MASHLMYPCGCASYDGELFECSECKAKKKQLREMQRDLERNLRDIFVRVEGEWMFAESSGDYTATELRLVANILDKKNGVK